MYYLSIAGHCDRKELGLWERRLFSAMHILIYNIRFQTMKLLFWAHTRVEKVFILVKPDIITSSWAQVFVTIHMCIQLWGQAILVKTCSHKSFNHHPRSSNAKFTLTNIYCHVNSSFINSPDFSIMSVNNHYGLSCTLMYCACRTYPQEGHSLYIIFCNTWDEDECFVICCYEKMELWMNISL